MMIKEGIKKNYLSGLLITALLQAVGGCLFAYGAYYGFRGINDYNNSFFLYCTLALILLGFALYNIIRIVTGLYLKKYKNSLSLYGIKEETLESDCESSVVVHKAILGRKYFIYTGKQPFAIPYENIIWAYIQKKKTKRIGPNPEMISYNLFLYDDRNTITKIVLKKEAQAQEILAKLKEYAPFAYYGYTSEYFNLYSCSFDQMLQEVNKRKSSKDF